MKTKTASVKQLKNTPGPWRNGTCFANLSMLIRTKSDGDYATDIFAGKGDASECVATVVQSSVRDAQVCEHNARLMIASPELFAACEAFVKLFDSDKEPWWTEEHFNAYQAAQAAIAKVKGR